MVQKNRIFDLKSTFKILFVKTIFIIVNTLNGNRSVQYFILKHSKSARGKFLEFKTFLATTLNQFRPSVIALHYFITSEVRIYFRKLPPFTL